MSAHTSMRSMARSRSRFPNGDFGKPDGNLVKVLQVSSTIDAAHMPRGRRARNSIPSAALRRWGSAANLETGTPGVLIDDSACCQVWQPLPAEDDALALPRSRGKRARHHDFSWSMHDDRPSGRRHHPAFAGLARGRWICRCRRPLSIRARTRLAGAGHTTIGFGRHHASRCLRWCPSRGFTSRHRRRISRTPPDAAQENTSRLRSHPPPQKCARRSWNRRTETRCAGLLVWAAAAPAPPARAAWRRQPK